MKIAVPALSMSRRAALGVAAGGVLGLAWPFAGAAGALARAEAVAAPTIDFDVVYIPPLFLTGGTDRSAQGPAQARVRWHAIERLPIDAHALRLSTAREARLRQALAEEGEVLAALSAALRQADGPALRKTAAAIKPPFVRAYPAFGLGPGERAPE